MDVDNTEVVLLGRITQNKKNRSLSIMSNMGIEFSRVKQDKAFLWSGASGFNPISLWSS